ncbi:hypothetical protein [Phenylobacterium sp.]|uniref:hypothetical protein n=1 Tax=Phenylobacterium sp. TaxID=1871053 RepID=UPI0035628957
MAKGRCYRCGAPGTSREHFPPKAFFPRAANLQLKTVRSCDLHNTEKSGDDQYLLGHICLHAARGQNLAAQVFMRSIMPQITTSKSFAGQFRADAPDIGAGAMYPVDVARFDAFFDALSCAIYFDRFRTQFDPGMHRLRHAYPSLVSADGADNQMARQMRSSFSSFFQRYEDKVERFQSDKVDEVIYGHEMMAPAGTKASITIAHTFYGVFEVITLMTFSPWQIANAVGS